jgi:hypothetical protein
MGNILYVAYGGHYGDCAGYHGWVVGVSIAKPETVKAWCTQAKGGGIWGVGGIANDGKDIFVVTGNTFDTGGTWGGGNSVFRLHPGPVFSGNTADYWGPTNWYDLDKGDNDMGGSGAILLDVPGANPSELVLTLGKDAKAYLLDRARLGGITEALATESVSRNSIIQAATTYRTDRGIHVVFRGSERTVQSLRIEAARPPKIVMDWSVTQHGKGSPFVTMSDGKNDLLVWSLGAEGDQRLHAYDGDTGEVVYDGGGEGELMTGTRRFSTGIVARGRIYVAADEKVYAFVPATAK